MLPIRHHTHAPEEQVPVSIEGLISIPSVSDGVGLEADQRVLDGLLPAVPWPLRTRQGESQSVVLLLGRYDCIGGSAVTCHAEHRNVKCRAG